MIDRRPSSGKFAAAALLGALVATPSCAPVAVRHREPQRLPTLPGVARGPAPVEPLPPEPPRAPIPPDARIKEQDLRSQEPPPPPIAVGPSRPVPERGDPSPAPLPDDSSLLAKLTPGTSPQRAASLRLTEEGRKLLEAGDHAKAFNRLERAIVIDSSNPYGYFYLAKAHHAAGRYQESLNFLDVAESRLATEPFWLAEVHALRGENFRALGMGERAEASYAEALKINSGNRTAADAIGRLQGGRR